VDFGAAGAGKDAHVHFANATDTGGHWPRKATRKMARPQLTDGESETERAESQRERTGKIRRADLCAANNFWAAATRSLLARHAHFRRRKKGAVGGKGKGTWVGQ